MADPFLSIIFINVCMSWCIFM